jgi:hypothetical protein
MEASWLRSVSNGALGEARVRALLLNRFRVLTRSVDVDGADLIVELRTESRFTDLLPPQLGVVQAKFAQDETTIHYLPEAHVAPAGTAIDGYFMSMGLTVQLVGRLIDAKRQRL